MPVSLPRGIITAMRIKYVKPHDLTFVQRRVLWGLTLPEKHESSLLHHLRQALSKKPGFASTVLLAYSDKVIVGWAMIIKRHFACSIPFVMLYVRKSFRRKGIGSYLLRKAIDRTQVEYWAINPYVCAHDKQSDSFFSQFGNMVDITH